MTEPALLGASTLPPASSGAGSWDVPDCPRQVISGRWGAAPTGGVCLLVVAGPRPALPRPGRGRHHPLGEGLRGRGRPEPAPPKARTWARRGHTPVVRVSGKGSGRVSLAGLVCLRPGARGQLFYRMRIH